MIRGMRIQIGFGWIKINVATDCTDDTDVFASVIKTYKLSDIHLKLTLKNIRVIRAIRGKKIILMQKKIILLLSVALVFAATQAQIKWPTITQTNKPWTRWWWEGSAVNKKDLSWNLEQYQRAGLGGVEITPIYGIYGYEKQFINFLSPQWMQVFDHTLAEAKRLGLGVDLANGTGWPFGGPWVTDNDASKTIYFKTYSIKSGESLNDVIEYDKQHG